MKNGLLDRRLLINIIGQTMPLPTWRWNSGVLRDYDLIIVLDGLGTYSHGGDAWGVGAGSCMLFRRGESYSGRQDPVHPPAMNFIHFDILDRESRPTEFPPEELLPLHFKAERVDFVSELAQCAMRAHRLSRAERERGEAELWLRALLLEQWRQAQRPRWKGVAREQAVRVESLCAEIRATIGKAWRLEDIAARLGCGPEHAGRLFRRYRGVSPGEFVVQARVEAARTLLGASSLGIGQIAETLGYCDVYAFSRQFKARTGLSPRAYRGQ